MSRDHAQLLDAAGNRFWLLDRFHAGALPAAQAERWAGLPKDEADGLLQLLPGRGSASCGMRVHNRDGSRPEACGNGLRCIAVLAHERGYAPSRFTVRTDAGLREVVVEAGDERRARVELGVPLVLERQAELGGDQAPRGFLVSFGNPHCVIHCDDVESAAVAEIGQALQSHPLFPEGTNVEFVQRTPDGLRVRVWERGVGETLSCGTGVGAAFWASPDVHPRAQVWTRGGTLAVERGADGRVWLEGPVRSVGSRPDPLGLHAS